MARPQAHRSNALPLLAAIFALTHALYYALGVRFDLSTLPWYIQFLDPELLRTRLLESLVYLHSQPPLYNLFLGLVLKLAPGWEAAAFQACYLACGFVFYAALHGLLRGLGVRPLLALALSTLFMAGPPFVLYEHWLFYTFPLATLLTLAAWFLLGALRGGSRARWAGFFTCLLLVLGTRSLFHLAYLVFVAGALAALMRDQRRTILLAALLPALLVLALYGKNLALFGKFTSSTWMGMNVWTMTARNLPAAERRALVADGVLSPISQVDRFADPENYPPAYFAAPAYPAVPAVSQLRKSTGEPNFNHLGYIALSDAYLRDALVVLRRAPRTYLIGSLRAWFAYFRATDDNLFLDRANRAHLAALAAFYDVAFAGKLPRDLADIPGLPIYSDSKGHYVYLFLLVGLPLVWLYGVRLAWRGGAAQPLDRAARLTVAFLCLNIAYVALMGNALEIGENNRFRFMTDAASLVLLGLFLERKIRKVGRR